MNKWTALSLVAMAIGFGAAAQSLTASPALPAPSSLPASAASAKIAFITTGELSVINADGSAERRLADLGPWVAQRAHFLASRPAWSPDGQRIAYVGVRDDGNLDIYVVRVDRRGRRRLTRVPAADGCPVWSPDGRKIAFTRQEGFYEFDIYVMNADGSGQRRLTRNGWLHFSVAWSPDGRKMLFERPDLPRTDAEELWITTPLAAVNGG